MSDNVDQQKNIPTPASEASNIIIKNFAEGWGGITSSLPPHMSK